MATKPKPKIGVTGTAVGKHLDISQPRVSQLADEGVFNRNQHRRFDLDDCRLAYIRWLRDDQRRVTKAAGANRVSDARARKIELEIAREEHRIIDLEEHDAVVDEIVGMFTVGLNSLPAQVTRDLAQRRTIETACTELRQRLADRAAERSAQLREAGEAIDAPVGDDA